MKRLVIYTSLSFLPFTSSGQSLAKHALKLFNSSILQESKNKVSIGSNPWVACNSDSGFYRTDTIALFNDFYDCSNCKEFVQWTFYRKGYFYFGGARMCEEPTKGFVYRENRWHSIRVKKNEKNVLELIKSGMVIDTFRVLSISRVETGSNPKSTMLIRLVRLGL